MLLGGDSHHEGGNVDHLLADGDVSLSDENAGVVNGLSELSLLDLGLETSLKELGGGQTEHIIELSLGVLKESEAHHTSDEGLTYLRTNI